MPSDKDIIEETRTLFGSYQRGNRSADMTTNAFLLLHALADEVEQLREQWNTRFSVLCGNCGQRYRGPRDEHLHGYDICNVPRKD